MASVQKVPRLALRRKYHSALSAYVNAVTRGAEPARALGWQAVKAGVDTLELCKIHEAALTLLLRNRRSLLVSYVVPLATDFFAEAIRPIKESHRDAQVANAQMQKLIEKLTLSSTELATSNRKLNREVCRRKAMEGSLLLNQQTLSTLLDEARLMQAELRHLSRRLFLAQEEERKKISRELHDVIAQILMGINYRLGTLATLQPAMAEDMRKNIAGTQRLVAKSVDIVNRFARDLRPATLDHLGLIPTLHSFLKGFMERTGIRVSLTAFKGIETLGESRKTMLYRVAQETLANAARHARASQVEVCITKTRSSIRMEITDNGQGFDPLVLPSIRRKRLGLLGMKERVEMFGGKFTVKSHPHTGTAILVDLSASSLRKKAPAAGRLS